ncbi:AMP-binding protein [Methylobacterium komagatae]
MSAHAAEFSAPPADEPLRHGLASALIAAAQVHPQRTLLRDSGDRTAWCGRPSINWTYAAAAEIVGRLARGIAAWRLAPGSRIGLCFAGGAEATLAHLAVEAAGHLPCLLSPVWDEDALSCAVESAGLVAVLTEGRRGQRRPAEELTHTALRHFSLRFIAAFGPGLPDGVISLDAMALERGVIDPQRGLGLLTFAVADPRRPVKRDAAGFDAAVAAHRERLASPERVLTLLPPHDLRGLVTGLGLALASGASLETLIPFDSASFRIALLRPVPTRLVVPAAFESALADITLPWTVRAIDIVHRAPARLPEPSVRDMAGPPCPRRAGAGRGCDPHPPPGPMGTTEARRRDGRIHSSRRRHAAGRRENSIPHRPFAARNGNPFHDRHLEGIRLLCGSVERRLERHSCYLNDPSKPVHAPLSLRHSPFVQSTIGGSNRLLVGLA